MAPMQSIIDTDPGVDDALAILLALASPELLVVAITLTHGNTSLSSAKHNLLKILFAIERHLTNCGDPAAEKLKWPGLDMDLREKHGVGKIQIIMGSQGPVAGRAVEAKYFHGKDGLSDVTTRHPELSYPAHFVESDSHPFFQLSSLTSTDYLMKLAGDRSVWGQIGYVALGPLTSLAKFIQQHQRENPEEKREIIQDLFSCVLVMGGAIDVPGNTSPTSEFNTYADPYAAQIVLNRDRGLENLWLFPLDITSRHTLPFETYKSLVDEDFEGIEKPSQFPKAWLADSFYSSSRSAMSLPSSSTTLVSSPGESSHCLPSLPSTLASSPIISPASTSVSTTDPGKTRNGGGHHDIKQNGKGHLVHFTSSFLEGTMEVMKKFGSKAMEMHDPLVIWALIEFAKHHFSYVSTRKKEDVDSVKSIKPSSLDSAPKTTHDVGNEEVDRHQDQDIQSTSTSHNKGALESSLTLDLALGWTWEWKAFEIETTGTLTRGMLITDRRRSAKINTLSSGQTNRALAFEEQERKRKQEQRRKVEQDQRQEVNDRKKKKNNIFLSGLLVKDEFNSENDKSDKKFDEVDDEVDDDDDDDDNRAGNKNRGVKVVTGTPGGDTLRTVLLSRIWGVNISVQ